MIMITGLPGTGKSTLAAAVSNAMGAHHLNTDLVREHLGKRGQYDEETKQLVYAEMLRQAEAFLRAGQGVVIDGTFYRERLREPFQRLAERMNVACRWVEIRAEDTTVRTRINRPRAHSEADFSVYQKIKALYEPLDRAHLVLWSDQLSVTEMVERTRDFVLLPS